MRIPLYMRNIHIILSYLFVFFLLLLPEVEFSIFIR